MEQNYQHRAPKEFEEKVIEVNRVSKKTKGGNQISFSVLVVIGNKKGKVGAGLGKAPDVLSAIKKGVRIAKRKLIEVPIVNQTIPHDIYVKKGAAKIIFKPAAEGTGIIAGGAIRTVVEVSGIGNIVSKRLGSRNKISNVRATLEAFKSLKTDLSIQDHQKNKVLKPESNNLRLKKKSKTKSEQ
jgi:small subunit ribosomal protein S5